MGRKRAWGGSEPRAEGAWGDGVKTRRPESDGSQVCAARNGVGVRWRRLPATARGRCEHNGLNRPGDPARSLKPECAPTARCLRCFCMTRDISGAIHPPRHAPACRGPPRPASVRPAPVRPAPARPSHARARGYWGGAGRGGAGRGARACAHTCACAHTYVCVHTHVCAHPLSRLNARLLGEATLRDLFQAQERVSDDKARHVSSLKFVQNYGITEVEHERPLSFRANRAHDACTS